MKELLEQFSTYHIWANKQMMDCILALPAEMQVREVPSSFPSLHKTLRHMLFAEWVWWKRVTTDKPAVESFDEFAGDTSAHCAVLQKQSLLWNEWIKGRTIQDLESIITYTRLTGKTYTTPLYQIVFHVHNHGTYHRGQLVTMLRELELDKIPQTDFTAWTRE